MDKSRSDFEDWFVEISHGNGDLTLNICGDYDCFYARNFWLAWQASRAVEIDLPDNKEDCNDYQQGFNDAIYACHESIVNAGYKFKE